MRVDGQAGANRGESSPSVLTSIVHTSTPIMIVTVVIAIMSFYLIALVVWMAIHYRTIAAIPPELVRDVQNLLDQNKFNEAYHRLVDHSSFLARVLASGVRKLPSGVVQAQRAMELANEDATMEMEHRTTYLATVGTLGPMIGLVGTVYGMIMAFQVIALEGSPPRPVSSPRESRPRSTRRSRESPSPYRRSSSTPFTAIGSPVSHSRWGWQQTLCSSSSRRASAQRRRARPPAKTRRRHLRPIPIPSLSAQRSRRRGPLRHVPRCRRLRRERNPMPSRRKRSATASVLSPNLTPLLDVVLQLITFFMMLVHFGTKLEGATKAVRLPVAPAALPGSDLTFDRLGVAIDAQGRLLVEGRKLDEQAASAWWTDQAKIRRAGLETLDEQAAGNDTLPTVVMFELIEPPRTEPSGGHLPKLRTRVSLISVSSSCGVAADEYGCATGNGDALAVSDRLAGAGFAAISAGHAGGGIIPCRADA